MIIRNSIWFALIGILLTLLNCSNSKSDSVIASDVDDSNFSFKEVLSAEEFKKLNYQLMDSASSIPYSTLFRNELNYLQINNSNNIDIGNTSEWTNNELEECLFIEEFYPEDGEYGGEVGVRFIVFRYNKIAQNDMLNIELKGKFLDTLGIEFDSIVSIKTSIELEQDKNTVILDLYDISPEINSEPVLNKFKISLCLRSKSLQKLKCPVLIGTYWKDLYRE